MPKFAAMVMPNLWGSMNSGRHTITRRMVPPAASAQSQDGWRLLFNGENLWISMINRDGRLIQVGRDTVLHAGDEILALTDADNTGVDPGTIFTAVSARED